MRRPILSVTIFSSFLLAGTAYATIDCAVLPTCDSLGYTDQISVCPKDYLPCPFDSTKGKCLLNAEPGSVQYFTKAPGKGWLQCNGYFYHKDAYPDLYAAIGTTIGGSGSVFQVPDYAGDFLRVYGNNSGSINKRQQEGLPNLYGSTAFSAPGNYELSMSGVFAAASVSRSGSAADNTKTYGLNFDASRYNSIYGNSLHVTPVNTAVYAYMFAGRTDTSKGSAASIMGSCVKGNYLYTDGTCSSSYNSSKTLKGIVNQVYSGSTYSYVQYIWGGSPSYYAYSGTTASNNCANNGGWLASNSYWTSLPTNISTSQPTVRSIQSGKYYWGYTSTKYYCSSQTSCASSTASGDNTTGGSNYPYYYCYSYMYFAK